VHPKDKQDKKDITESVYKVPCGNCEKTYVWETGRKLGVRLHKHKTEAESKTKQAFTTSQRTTSLTEYSRYSPTMRIKPIIQSTGKRLQPSTENKSVLLGGWRKLYISARKVIELWIETRAAISWLMSMTAFLMRQLIIASRLGRTEYQLLLMKISWWGRKVKIR